MATRTAPTVRPEDSPSSRAEPLLEPGDRLSRDEFARRYQRMPNIKKAELIEGTVYMPSPIRAESHAGPTAFLAPGSASMRLKPQAPSLSIIQPSVLTSTTSRSQLREGAYHEIGPDGNGLLKSGLFPGLWLDTRAMLRGDMKAVLATLRQGLDASEHAAFLTG